MSNKTNGCFGQYYYGEQATNPLPYNEISLNNWYNFPCEYVFDWNKIKRFEAKKNLLDLQVVEKGRNDKAQIYIHIPYCRSYCAYCVFTRERFAKQTYADFDQYVDYVIKELDCYLDMPYLKSMPITAITIGGGSPSTLPPKILVKLFDHLEKTVPHYHSLEKTFTGEPRTLRYIEVLKLLKEYGWNRVTFGIESVRNDIKKEIGRLATNEDVEAVFNGLRAINYPGEINIDLMYNLPGQSFEDFKEELDILVHHYQPDSLDAFPTIYVPFSRLYNLIASGVRKQPACIWELLKMKEYLYDYLLTNGYQNLFSTAYAKKEFKHSSFHKGAYGIEDVITVGIGAFGSIKNMATVNPLDLTTWMKNIDEYGVSTETIQPLSDELYLIKTMVLFPRINKLSKSELYKHEKTRGFAKMLSILNSQIAKGLVIEKDDEYETTSLGLIWYSSLQVDYLRDILNKNGTDLVALLSYPSSAFGNSSRLKKTDVLRNMVFR